MRGLLVVLVQQLREMCGEGRDGWRCSISDQKPLWRRTILRVQPIAIDVRQIAEVETATPVKRWKASAMSCRSDSASHSVRARRSGSRR